MSSFFIVRRAWEHGHEEDARWLLAGVVARHRHVERYHRRGPRDAHNRRGRDALCCELIGNSRNTRSVCLSRNAL
jgi:hypothetical protein